MGVFQRPAWIQAQDQGFLGQLQEKTENSEQKGYLILLIQSPVIINNKAVDFQCLGFFLQLQYSNLFIDVFQDTHKLTTTMLDWNEKKKIFVL